AARADRASVLPRVDAVRARRALQAAAWHRENADPERHDCPARSARRTVHRPMTDDDPVEFDDIIAMALAESASVNAPPPHPRLRERVLLALRSVDARAQDAPAGFAFHWAGDDRWLPHPVPGIRMKILSLNKARGYATLLLDVAPGSRFPAHH